MLLRAAGADGSPRRRHLQVLKVLTPVRRARAEHSFRISDAPPSDTHCFHVLVTVQVLTARRAGAMLTSSGGARVSSRWCAQPPASHGAGRRTHGQRGSSTNLVSEFLPPAPTSWSPLWTVEEWLEVASRRPHQSTLLRRGPADLGPPCDNLHSVTTRPRQAQCQCTLTVPMRIPADTRVSV